MNNFNLLISAFLFNTIAVVPQTNNNPDSITHIQYRRGLEMQNNCQSYDKYYEGKNLQEEKRRLFPLSNVNSATGVWTELNPKVPRVIYAGIYFVNKDTGWAVGDLGALIKTTDGGIHWKVIETNTTKPILKLRSYNGQIVIASGYDGLILRSTNGGETFNQVPSGVGNLFDLWGLEMINDTLGWACGATALLKTTDGGESWLIVNTPGYTGNLWWIEFMNERYGFVAADGNVLKTTDGGTNWEVIQAGDYRPLYCLDIIDSLHIATAGYGGTDYSAKNLYSSDGGHTWINGGPTTTEPINDIKYIGLDTGYIIMNNVIAKKTTNRGQEWIGIYAGGEYEMQFFEEDSIGYSAGTDLRLYKTENGYENWERLIINDYFSDVFFVSPQKGFAVSSALSSNYYGLYKTTNGGLDWKCVPGAPDGIDLLFLDSLTGFIGTNVIYKTTDGGESWYMPTGGSGGARKIFFINEIIGWAVRSNVIYKTTDRGENWIVQFPASLSVSFYSIHFVDSLYGWTANSGGRPYKTTDGGTNWTQQTNLNIWISDDVYFANRDIGWIVDDTDWGDVKKTTDGGTSWVTIPEIIGPLRFHFFPDTCHWMIYGDRRYITEDGGNTFIDITSDVSAKFNGFSAVTDKLGYAAGGTGLILRYDDTTYLPVELISFEGKVNDSKIILSWITASELNNQGFYIEKSYDKINWETIGFTPGKGTSTEKNYYWFIDDRPSKVELYYRLRQVDFNGTFIYSEIITLTNILSTFELYQNYPNPFNPKTKISFSLPVDSKITLKIFDILGTEIKTLINESMSSGYHDLEFNASTYSSGIYFYRLKAEGVNGRIFNAIKKMIIIK